MRESVHVLHQDIQCFCATGRAVDARQHGRHVRLPDRLQDLRHNAQVYFLYRARLRQPCVPVRVSTAVQWGVLGRCRVAGPGYWAPRDHSHGCNGRDTGRVGSRAAVFMLVSMVCVPRWVSDQPKAYVPCPGHRRRTAGSRARPAARPRCRRPAAAAVSASTWPAHRPSIRASRPASASSGRSWPGCRGPARRC
jgi:hypothetical protein